jgi:hypothetical protein
MIIDRALIVEQIYFFNNFFTIYLVQDTLHEVPTHHIQAGKTRGLGPAAWLGASLPAVGWAKCQPLSCPAARLGGRKTSHQVGGRAVTN